MPERVLAALRGATVVATTTVVTAGRERVDEVRVDLDPGFATRTIDSSRRLGDSTLTATITDPDGTVLWNKAFKAADTTSRSFRIPVARRPLLEVDPSGGVALLAPAPRIQLAMTHPLAVTDA